MIETLPAVVSRIRVGRYYVRVSMIGMLRSRGRLIIGAQPASRMSRVVGTDRKGKLALMVENDLLYITVNRVFLVVYNNIQGPLACLGSFS